MLKTCVGLGHPFQTTAILLLCRSDLTMQKTRDGAKIIETLRKTLF